MNILITGANRGIGLALTRVFLERGHTVFAGTRRPDDSPALKELAEQYPKTLHLHRLDVTAGLEVITLGYLLDETDTVVDVLINNAGVMLEDFTVKFESLLPTNFDQTFAVNVTGVAVVTQACLPLLRRSASPRIVNISSGAGSISNKSDHSHYIYGASKAALNHLTVGLAHEFRPENIIVTAISPGWVRTDMGGRNAALAAEESAAAMAETIIHLTMDDSGKFLGRSGSADDYVW